jgi:hypothetical protein
MQNFDLESLLMRGNHSQKVKANPPSEAIMAYKIALIYRLQLPFLGLWTERFFGIVSTSSLIRVMKRMDY